MDPTGSSPVQAFLHGNRDDEVTGACRETSPLRGRTSLARKRGVVREPLADRQAKRRRQADASMECERKTNKAQLKHILYYQGHFPPSVAAETNADQALVPLRERTVRRMPWRKNNKATERGVGLGGTCFTGLAAACHWGQCHQELEYLKRHSLN